MVALLTAGAATPGSPSAWAQDPAPVEAGLLDVGGRCLYLECRGTGSPTVVLEAGYGNRADIWSVDLLQPAGSRLMVWQAAAEFTRVCAYDRPGTIGQVNPDDRPPGQTAAIIPSRSDSAPMPRTARDLVDDLHALLQAGEVPGPYVFVGHSLGGLVVQLYARRYPEDVVGLVLVDASHEDSEARVRALLTPAQWAALQELQQGVRAGYPDFEAVDFEVSSDQLRQARSALPLRPMPLAVLSRGTSDDAPFADWPSAELEPVLRALQEDLASLVPNARLFVASRSGHYVHQEQPSLVTEAIRQVVTGARGPDTWNDLVSCCAR
jgi:pimeloyl-ACP methyl ester carboxylesterase